MPAYSYTVIVTEHNSITEVSGVVEASDIETARQTLTKNGYLVRNLRPATAEEIKLEVLRKYRKKLMGKPPTPSLPRTPPTHTLDEFVRPLPWKYLIMALIFGFIVVCFILFGGSHG